MKKIIAFTFLFALLTTAQAQITSTFDTDADGWLFYNASFTSSTVNFNSTNGNPGGYISATYASNSGTTNANTNFNNQVWVAPAKFLGDHMARSLSMNLKFDLQQSQAGVASGIDVVIQNAGNYIHFNLPVKPGVAPAWTSYSLPLDETIAWIYSSGATIATRSQIKNILTNVTSIEIRGTYATNASYTSGLDNVVLEQRTLTAAPIASSLSTTSGKPGQTITILGSGFNPSNANNVVYFGAVTGTVTNATATQLTVTIPVGAQYGKITIINTITGLTGTSRQPFNPLFDGGGRIIRDSFKPRIDITPSIDMEGFFIADIDGDGWSDVAIASSSVYKTIDIYRNLGLGGDITTASFAPKVSVTIPGTSTNYTGLQFVDLDGDGKLDLNTSNVLVNFGGAYFITYRNISTPGNIAFEAAETWAGLTDDSSPSLIADLDGDGRPELVGGEGSFSTGAYFWVAQNISSPGDIEFGGSVGYFINASNGGFGGASVTDLDGDGKPEMLVAHGDRFSIFKNNSSPGIISMTSIGMITSGQYIGSLQGVDFNLDGKNDLVWKNNGVTIYVRLNTNSGTALALTDFTSEITFAGDLNSYGAFSIADINGDGKPDIAASEDGDLGVYENVYSGGAFDSNSFIPAYQLQGIANGTYPTSPVAADLNGDGKPELVVATSNAAIRISIFENKNVHAPVISVNTVSPLAGPIGSTVTITGNNFSTTLTDNKVWFGGVEATVLTATPTTLTVSVPAGAGYAPVSVTKFGLTSKYRLPFKITFSPGVTFNNTHFAPPVNFTLATADYDIEVGDLNRDGKPDVFAEGGSGRGIAFRNVHTTGSIATGSLVPDDTVVNSFLNPRLEDFDGDGLLDVIAVNGEAVKNNSTLNEISFLPKTNLGYGASIVDMADFNNDGKTDFALTVDLSGTFDLVVRENRTMSIPGNFISGTYGSFSQNILFDKYGADGAVLTGDFDGDGFADMITTNPGSDNISIYRNLGVLKISAAQFATRINVAVGDNPNRIYKGDFDNDGKLDLLLYHWTGTSSALLVVLHNTSSAGNISFSRIDLTNPNFVTVAHVADLDGDGKPEILTTAEANNQFSIFKNLHTSGALTASSFGTPFNVTVTAPRGITTGDLNLDGKPEIIITRAAGLLAVYENLITPVSPPTITSFTPTSAPVGTTVTITGTNFDATPANNIVYFGATRATVTAATTTQLTVTVPTGATYAPITELNATTDLLAYSMSNFTPTFLPNKGSITTADFEPKVDFTTGANPLSVSIGDLDGDGKADLAVANTASNSISVLRNTSTGTGNISYATKIDYPSAADPESVSIGDLDGDGKADLAVANYIGFSVSVFRNTSTGAGNISYAAKVDFATGVTHRSISIGDFDGDGKADLVVASDNASSISVLRNTSSGPGNISYAAKVDFTTGVGSSPMSVSVGDLDGDGKADLAVVNFNNAVSIFRNTSTGEGNISFAAKVDFTAGTNPIAVSIGDLDSDGKADLAVVNKNSNSVSVLRNTSTGAGNINYAAKVDYAVADDPRSVSVGDLDGDGKPDLAVTNYTNNSVTVLRNTSTGAGNVGYAAKVDFTTGTNPVSVSIGDSDGDGKSDLVVTNASSNSVSIIRNNPVFSTITINPQPTSAAVCEGGVAVFTLTASGTTNLVYQWQKFDGTTFNNISNTGGYSGATTSTLTITTTGGFGVGDYRCSVSGDNTAPVFSQTASLTFTGNTTVAEITVNGNILTASSGDSYQWYQNDVEVNGATNQSFEFNVLEYGVFTVDVTDNGCTATSDPYAYLITGIENSDMKFKLSPNPVENILSIEYHPPYSVSITTTSGSIVGNANSNERATTINLSSLASGMYFLQLKNEKGITYHRIVKK